MQALWNRIISFFMSVLAFFGLVKTPATPAGPEPPAQHSVTYVAHRGATFAAPENTLPAFEAAARDGCTAVELDVRRTKDGVLVLSHNSTVKGTADGAQTSRRIADSTYASLCELSLGQDAAGNAIRIPTLAQALELLRGLGMEAMIHCKLTDEAFLRQAARTVKECGMSGKSAYNTDKDFYVTVPAVLAEDPDAVFHVPYDAASSDKNLSSLVSRPGAIVATVDVSALTGETAARIRAEGWSFYIWNVDADSLKAALAAAPDYIEFVSGVRVSELIVR